MLATFDAPAQPAADRHRARRPHRRPGHRAAPVREQPVQHHHPERRRPGPARGRLEARPLVGAVRNSVRMFFDEDRWLLVTIGSMLAWCVLAGGAAILYRVRQT